MAVPKPRARIEYVEIGLDDEFELDWQDVVLDVEGSVRFTEDDGGHYDQTITLTILRRPGQ